jgi:hypothetical protein
MNDTAGTNVCLPESGSNMRHLSGRKATKEGSTGKNPAKLRWRALQRADRDRFNWAPAPIDHLLDLNPLMP